MYILEKLKEEKAMEKLKEKRIIEELKNERLRIRAEEKEKERAHKEKRAEDRRYSREFTKQWEEDKAKKRLIDRQQTQEFRMEKQAAKIEASIARNGNYFDSQSNMTGRIKKHFEDNPGDKNLIRTTEEMLVEVAKTMDIGQSNKQQLSKILHALGFMQIQGTRNSIKGYYWKHQSFIEMEKYQLKKQIKSKDRRALIKQKQKDDLFEKINGYPDPKIKKRAPVVERKEKPEPLGYVKQQSINRIAQVKAPNPSAQTQEPMHIFNFKDIPERFNIFLKNRTPDQLKNGFTVDEAALELNCLPMNISDLVKQNPNLERRVKTIVGYYYDIPKAQIEKKNQPMTALELSTYADLYDLEDLA